MIRIQKLLCFLMLLFACHKTQAQHFNGNTTATNFPFIIVATSNEYDITIDLSDTAVINRYKPLFKKNKLAFDADNFEELMHQLLLQKDAVMAQAIITASEEKKVMIGTGNKIYQQNLIRLLQPILKDATELDSFIKKMDKSGMGE